MDVSHCLISVWIGWSLSEISLLLGAAFMPRLFALIWAVRTLVQTCPCTCPSLVKLPVNTVSCPDANSQTWVWCMMSDTSHNSAIAWQSQDNLLTYFSWICATTSILSGDQQMVTSVWLPFLVQLCHFRWVLWGWALCCPSHSSTHLAITLSSPWCY